jgi:hypothetical protein
MEMTRSAKAPEKRRSLALRLGATYPAQSDSCCDDPFVLPCSHCFVDFDQPAGNACNAACSVGGRGYICGDDKTNTGPGPLHSPNPKKQTQTAQAAMTARLPRPVVVPPSGSFDGVDGAWSTFHINVGDDGSGKYGQNFKVLASTSRSVTLLPLRADWCSIPSREQCAEDRGILPYNSEQSLGYQANASRRHASLGLFSLEPSLAVHTQPENGQYGLDSIGVGLASAESLVLDRQPVAGYVAKEPFLPSIGLAAALVDVGSGGLSPYLGGLNASGVIPSLSYSYTAGARYRECSPKLRGKSMALTNK